MHRFRIFVVGMALCAAVVPGAWPQETAPVFRVGTAMVDITPQHPMPMWGYGARHADLSEGVSDPLRAKATVIDVGEDKLALVGLDLGRSPMADSMQRIRAAVKDRAGVNYVMLVGSHTHHGPVLELADEEGKGKGVFDEGVAYIEGLEGKLVGVIVEAAANVQDARMGWGITHVDLNRNRHTKFEPKPRDTELNVLRFDDLNGNPLSILVNFAAHPTMLPSEELKFSADYPGQMMKEVERALDVHCQFMQGAAGDMSVKPPSGGRDIEAFGKALADEVLAVARGIETAVPTSPSIEGMDEDFRLEPRVELTNAMLQKLLKEAFFPELINRAMDELGGGFIEPHLTTILLNRDVALVGASGEFFSEHANRLKARSRIKTLFFGYCNGHHMYFPTIEAAAEGGYGGDASVSWVPLGTGEMMINQALANIYTMLGRYNRPFEKKVVAWEALDD